MTVVARWAQMWGWEWLLPRPFRRRLHFERKAVVTDLQCILCDVVYPFHVHPQPTECVICGGMVCGRFQLMIWIPLKPIGMPR